MSRQFAILGLGYFGVTVAEELRHRHHQVLGVDPDEARVNALSDLLSHAMVADITDEQALSELSLDAYDAVIIDPNDNIEASMTCTLLAREQGAREIWVKAHSDTHYRLLKHLGADHVVYPEFDSGMRVAESLHYHAMLDYIDLGDRHFVVDLEVTQRLCSEFATVDDLELSKLDLSLIAIKRGHELLKSPEGNTSLEEHDHLVLIGNLDDLRTLGRKR
ncbi:MULTISPECIES: TrkA family potassium uptake protein [Halomonadaceae]|uniref:potassium channel family protein n=1 Tax=Halomonadaceae TaxID=28256 RepID=UPI00159B131F|nr:MULTISPECIES: TrkA family potassium uptake protein [Halomonas]QJQ96307.1 TrkA family potassium uptake protein [Halomonas sp. PA5]